MSKTLDQRFQEYQNTINKLSAELNQMELHKNNTLQLINETAGALKLVVQMMDEKKKEAESESESESEVPVDQKKCVADAQTKTEEKAPLSGAREAADSARNRAKLEKDILNKKLEDLKNKSRK